MSIGMLRRIERLEDAARINVPRTFIIWNNGPERVAAEREKLRREQGATDVDRVIVAGWLPVQERPCA